MRLSLAAKTFLAPEHLERQSMDKRAATVQTWKMVMIEKEKSKLTEVRKSVQENERNDDDEVAFNIVLGKMIRKKPVDSGPSKIKK